MNARRTAALILAAAALMALMRAHMPKMRPILRRAARR